MSKIELNKENSLVTYIFGFDVNGEGEAIKKWISDDGVLSTYEFDEPNTMRFEFFLSKDETKATLIEMFADRNVCKITY